MKRLILVLLMVMTGCVYAQSDWKGIEINSNGKYEILRENRIHDMSEIGAPNDTIRASIVVDDGDARTYPDSLKFSSAIVENDTLEISLTSDIGHSYQESIIRITNQKFTIRHRYLVDILPEVEFKVFEPKLILNSIKLEKGNEIRGNIEFKFKCVEPCENFSGIHKVKGNFKIEIR